jgi:ABC-type lipoprotein export system ATPase subunit
MGRADGEGRVGDPDASDLQRVSFARALLLEPAIIMADEPTASLDRASADALITILRKLADDEIAVLVASHDQKLIDHADSRTRVD